MKRFFKVQFKKFIFFIFLILFILNFLVQTLQAQQIVVSGTEFNPNAANAQSAYFALNNITYYGIQDGQLTAGPAWFGGANLTTFRNQFNYLIAKNPVLINPNYINIPDDYMYIVTNNPGNQANVLIYTVDGLVPNSPVSVSIIYQNIIDSASLLAKGPENCKYVQSGLTGVINPAPGQNGTSMGFQMKASDPATQAIVNGTTDATGKMVFKVNTLFSNPCVDFGISRIEVKGSPQPSVLLKSEEQSCAGDYIHFEASNKYQGTFQWFVDGIPIAGATDSKLSVQSNPIPATHKYKYSVKLFQASTLTSTETTVSTIKCCESPNGSASSRTTIFHDDFGTLNSIDGSSFKVWDYTTDPRNPVQKVVPATTPYRMKLVTSSNISDPIGTLFQGKGAIFENQYAVVANMTQQNLEWANNILGNNPPLSLGYDHSGKIEGGALLINVPGQLGTLFQKTIPNICVNNGDKVFFECFITVFTCETTPVDINVTLNGGGLEVIERVVANSGCHAGMAINAGVWVPIRAMVQMLPPYSLKMSFSNNLASNLTGNDLVIDDIRVMACTPPNPIITLNSIRNSNTDNCEDLFLKVPMNKNLNNYYSNSNLNLFQWSKTPEILESWKNIAGPRKDSMFFLRDIQSFGNFNNGDTVNVRVVSGNLNDLTVPPMDGYNINDGCRNYSVSQPIQFNFNCSNITAVTLKAEEQILLYPNPGKDIINFKGEASSFSVYNHLGILVAKSENPTLNISAFEKGIYHVFVTDVKW